MKVSSSGILVVRRDKIQFLFLNVGHFLDHFFMLIFASVAALRLYMEWDMSYAELIPYATPGFIAFGVFAVFAGWLADKWSREGMIVIFFLGIGASSMLAGVADSPVEIAVSLTLIGAFASIYHPVGLAMVVHEREKPGVPLAINGVFGNMGVASAALLTGFLIDTSGWRSAFVAPGIASIVIGFLYILFVRTDRRVHTVGSGMKGAVRQTEPGVIPMNVLLRVFAVIYFTTAVGGLIFQSTTFSLPKVFDEQLVNVASSASMIGWYTFLVFAIAAMAQLLVGFLVDNYSIRPVFSAIALLQAAFFFAATRVSGIATVIVAIAFMFVVFGQIPINDVLVSRVVKSEWRSRAYGLRYIVTFSVMASAVPLIAWIHGSWGFGRLFELLSLAALLIFAATIFLPKSGHVVSGLSPSAAQAAKSAGIT